MDLVLLESWTFCFPVLGSRHCTCQHPAIGPASLHRRTKSMSFYGHSCDLWYPQFSCISDLMPSPVRGWSLRSKVFFKLRLTKPKTGFTIHPNWMLKKYKSKLFGGWVEVKHYEDWNKNKNPNYLEAEYRQGWEFTPLLFRASLFSFFLKEWLEQNEQIALFTFSNTGTIIKSDLFFLRVFLKTNKSKLLFLKVQKERFAVVTLYKKSEKSNLLS